MRKLFVSLLLLSAAGAPVHAQAWDSPTFFAPRPGEDIGIYGVKPADRGDWGVAAIWRQSGNLSLGVRAGYSGDEHVSLGAEFYGPLHLLGPQSPILMAWIVGVGGTFNDFTTLRVPAGVSIGARFSAGGMQIQPYVHPRVALDVFAYDLPNGQEQTETEINTDLDIGVDVELSESLVLRVGAALAQSRDLLGIGLAWRMPRRITVR